MVPDQASPRQVTLLVIIKHLRQPEVGVIYGLHSAIAVAIWRWCCRWRRFRGQSEQRRHRGVKPVQPYGSWSRSNIFYGFFSPGLAIPYLDVRLYRWTSKLPPLAWRLHTVLGLRLPNFYDLCWETYFERRQDRYWAELIKVRRR